MLAAPIVGADPWADRRTEQAISPCSNIRGWWIDWIAAPASRTRLSHRTILKSPALVVMRASG